MQEYPEGEASPLQADSGMVIGGETLRRLIAEARKDPAEVCGLLFGGARRIDAAERATNVAADPARSFEIDPASLFDAIRIERAGGRQLLGYYHSHPSGEPGPSATDAAMAAPDGRLWLILAGERATLWRAGARGRHGRFQAVELSVE